MARNTTEAVADPAESKKPVQIQRWLPYWAVLQNDLHQTFHSWIYRVWLLATLLAAGGYLLYRYAPYQEAGIIQTASTYLSDLLRWTLLVSAGLIVVLTAGAISAERGTMADSVLSRGISRYQYFLGKWHARLALVLGTYLITGAAAIVGSGFLLQEDLSYSGAFVALGTVTAVLAAIVTCGVTISALLNSTIFGIMLLWMVLYGGGFALSLLPSKVPGPFRLVQNLPYMLRGEYDPHFAWQLVLGSAILSAGMAIVGMFYFARRDV